MNSPERSMIGQWRLDLEYRRELVASPHFDPGAGIYVPKPADNHCECGAHHETTLNFEPGISRPVIITYLHRRRRWSNVTLRAFQLADMIHTLQPNLDIWVQPLENLYRAKPKQAIIIVHKTAIRRKSRILLDALKRWGNSVLFDLVDGVVPSELTKLPDAYICASLTEEAARISDGHQTIRSLQSPDQRTPVFPFDEKPFHLVYYGLRQNAQHLDSLPELKVVTYEEMPGHRAQAKLPDAFSSLRAASHHYSVRSWNPTDGFKPMMKGYFAARLGSVIIASAQDEESRLVLGRNYPFLSPSSRREDVIETIEYAKQVHNGPQWRQSVEVMKRLKRESCPVATATTLVTGLAEVNP